MDVLIADYDSSSCAERLAHSIHDTGFAIITNPPISPDLISQVYREWKIFFDSAEKHQYLYHPRTFDGYYPFRSENAKNSSVKNLMEYFHVYLRGQYPHTVSDAARQLMRELIKLSEIILTALDRGLPQHLRRQLSMPLMKMCQNPSSNVLRIIHCPPLDGNEEKGALRATEHEDSNLITLYPPPTDTGLQVRDPSGRWFDVPVEPGMIVINTGDMMKICTQGYYGSTTHRVVNPTGEAAKKFRMSMPLFVQPPKNVILSETYTAGSFQEEILHINGVI